jgi:hypothetical protein
LSPARFFIVSMVKVPRAKFVPESRRRQSPRLRGRIEALVLAFAFSFDSGRFVGKMEGRFWLPA